MKVTGKRILVEQALTPDVTEGGIVMTTKSIVPLPYGTIRQVGPDVEVKREFYTGDVVLFNEIGAIPLGHIKKDHVLIEAEDIMAILEEGEY